MRPQRSLQIRRRSRKKQHLRKFQSQILLQTEYLFICRSCTSNRFTFAVLPISLFKQACLLHRTRQYNGHLDLIFFAVRPLRQSARQDEDPSRPRPPRRRRLLRRRGGGRQHHPRHHARSDYYCSLLIWRKRKQNNSGPLPFLSDPVHLAPVRRRVRLGRRRHRPRKLPRLRPQEQRGHHHSRGLLPGKQIETSKRKICIRISSIDAPLQPSLQLQCGPEQRSLPLQCRRLLCLHAGLRWRRRT